MTREEAIADIRDNIKPIVGGKSLDMAIKALEQQPCEDCGEKMNFPRTFDEYVKVYGFKDSQEVYTNGSVLIPAFRARQWIEHLEQQPCEDCISREAVIKTIKEMSNANPSYTHTCDVVDRQDLIDSIDELPSVTPKTEWIPVSERLPEEDGFYLATLDGEICGEDKPFSGLAEFENGKWVDDEEDYQCVIAWMPLPQPYKESEDEK